ncbi:MAG: response regulator [Chloroflexi bacterium]|nr:response regulator [Chloroflexota bacterium]
MNGCRILIIDDEPMAVQLLELMLEKRNDQIFVATTSQEGLDIAEQVQPDLIIIRIMMREIDGVEICRRLKRIPALVNVPVLLQAAKAWEQVYPTAKEVGAAGYLYQPFSMDVLLEARDIVLQGGNFYPTPYPPFAAFKEQN